MHDETLFKSFDNNNTKKEKKRQEQISKKKRIGNKISVIQFVIIKWKAVKNNTKKRKTKN